MQKDSKYSFQKTYVLQPHSPLIHFQTNADGVSLRATEVKPKLDTFLKMRYRKKYDKEIPEKWIIPSKKEDETPALDYKLRFRQTQLLSTEKLGIRTDYDIFYGNMVSKKKRMNKHSEPITEKKGLKIKEEMTVICFQSELMDWIDKSIRDFFVVTNFGTMQRKGFGSFLVEGTNYNKEKIANLLTTYSGAKHCYSFKSDSKTVFKKIKLMYSIIKSGINLGTGKDNGDENYVNSLLFEYFHKVSIPIDHEKACLKASGVAPSVKKVGTKTRYNPKTKKDIRVPIFNTDTVPSKKNPNYRYVRALLGIGETVTYNDVNWPDGNTNRVTVNIEHDYGADNMKKEDRIARFPSPVFFKIIDNRVFFIGTPIEDVIYGKTFTFSVKGRSSVSIKVPKSSEMPEDFMNEFMDFAFEHLCTLINNRTDERAFMILRDVSLEKVV